MHLSNRSSRKRHRLSIEPLEPRVVLDARIGPVAVYDASLDNPDPTDFLQHGGWTATEVFTEGELGSPTAPAANAGFLDDAGTAAWQVNDQDEEPNGDAGDLPSYHYDLSPESVAVANEEGFHASWNVRFIEGGGFLSLGVNNVSGSGTLFGKPVGSVFRWGITLTEAGGILAGGSALDLPAGTDWSTFHTFNLVWAADAAEMSAFWDDQAPVTYAGQPTNTIYGGTVAEGGRLRFESGSSNNAGASDRVINVNQVTFPLIEPEIDLRINEVSADNESIAVDLLGNDPDWIEIHNAGNTAVDLAGWFLTDDALDPQKFAFPTAIIQPKEYLLVFASGCDVPGVDCPAAADEIHTNFRLDADGGYLALVEPDGATVASQLGISGVIPALPTNVSYGPTRLASLSNSTTFAEYDAGDAPTTAIDPASLEGGEWERVDTGGGVDTGGVNNDLGSGSNAWNVNDNTAAGGVFTEYRRTLSDEQLAIANERGWRLATHMRLVDGNGPNPVATLIHYDDGTRRTMLFFDEDNATGSLIAQGPGGERFDLGTNDDAYHDWELVFEPDSPGMAKFLFDGEEQGTVSFIASIGRDGVFFGSGSSGGQASSNFHDVRFEVFDVTDLFMQTPTPGAANVGGYLGFLSKPRIDVPAGIYSAADLQPGGRLADGVTIESADALPADATVLYTLDGSRPTLGNASVLELNDAIVVDRLTTLRAATAAIDYIDSPTATNTYLFLADVLTQDGAGLPPLTDTDYEFDPAIVGDARYDDLLGDLATLPSLSIVLPVEDIFGPEGIYENPAQLGREWERTASVELIAADGTIEFQEDAGLRIQGAGSRARPWAKKSLQLFFRGEYGAKKLDFPLFGDEGRGEFDRVALRGNFFDSWTVENQGAIGTACCGFDQALLLRDQFGHQTHADMGALAIDGRWMHLYLNGQYWGLYNPIEVPDEEFAADRFGGSPEDYDVLKQRPRGTPNGSPPEVVSGDLSAWNELLAALGGDIASAAVYEQIASMLDVDQFADYLILNFYGGNFDWPHNNWYAIKERADDARWTFVAWDTEHFLFEVTADRTEVNTDNSPGVIYDRLRLNEEFRLLFADRVQKHFFNDGALTPQANAERLSAIVTQIESAMNAESARWGDTHIEPPRNTIDTWLPVVQEKLDNYFPRRTGIVLDQFRADGLYPAVAAPLLNQHGGPVEAGFALEISAPSGEIYVTLDGSDPRLPGGDVSPTATRYVDSIPLNESVRVVARALDAGSWSASTDAVFRVAGHSALGNLIVSEINYHPAPPTPAELAIDASLDGEDFEFVELMNISASTVSLADVRFDAGDPIVFDFAAGEILSLAAGERLLVVKNSSAFQIRYGEGLPIAGEFVSGALANGGETIHLVADNGTIQSFAYDDELPWPIAPDGHGYSLVLKDPTANPDPRNPFNWRASGTPNGSPGTEDSPSTPAVVISEALTHTDAPQVDAIELWNPTGEEVDLTGWFLSDDANEPRKYVLPAGTTIPAAGRLVLFEDDDANPATDPGPDFFGSAFSLSSLGEEILIASGNGAELTGHTHGFPFGAAANGVSFIRHVDSAGFEHFTAQSGPPSLGDENEPFRLGAVVITEVHYAPDIADPSEPFRDEFVELMNLAEVATPLFDSEHPENTWRIGGAGFEFPPATVLQPNEVVLVVPGDPEAFRTANFVDPSVRILGPMSGNLRDDGERLRLQRPDAPGLDGFVPMIDVDVVDYADAAPWPAEPAAHSGDGSSLTRRVSELFGSDPASWHGVEPTPGRVLRDTGALQVYSVVPQGGVIDIQLSGPLDSSALNLYDGGDASLDTPDVLLASVGGGPLAGSLLWNAETNLLQWVATSGPLPAGQYALTLVSGGEAIVDPAGSALDGDGEGTPGGDFEFRFIVAFPTGRRIMLPNFVRGPGQAIDLEGGAGIPVSLDVAESVTEVEFELDFDPDLLRIDAVERADDLPGDWQIETTDTGEIGRLFVRAVGTTPLAAGMRELVRLTASVPASAELGGAHRLKIERALINSGALPAQGGSAFHVAAYLGDATNNAGYSGLDASFIARVAVGLDSGFDAMPRIDPVLLADVTGNGSISALDASFVARKAVGLPQPEIPDLPDASPPGALLNRHAKGRTNVADGQADISLEGLADRREANLSSTSATVAVTKQHLTARADTRPRGAADARIPIIESSSFERQSSRTRMARPNETPRGVAPEDGSDPEDDLLALIAIARRG